MEPCSVRITPRPDARRRRRVPGAARRHRRQPRHPRAGPRLPGTSVTSLSLGDHRLRHHVRRAARPRRPAGRRDRPAHAVPRRRRRLRRAVARLRAGAQRAGAARGPRGPGGVRRDDDPRLAGDPPGRHAGGAAGAPRWRCGAPPARSPPPWARASAACSSHAFGWRSLFVINVPAGLALAAAAGILPRTATRAHPPARRARHRAAGAAGSGWPRSGCRRARCGAGATPRTIASLAGGVAGTVAAVQRSWRHAGAGDRDRPVEAPHVRAGQRGLAAVRRQPVRLDAAGRARAHRAVALLRAAGGPGDDAGGDRRQHRGRRRRAPGHPADRGRRRGGADGGLGPVHRRHAAHPRRVPRPTGCRSGWCSARAWAW